MHNVRVYILVFSVTLIIALISVWSFYRRIKRSNKYYDELKKEGDAIPVNLLECEIKTNEYYESPVHDHTPSRIEILDGLSNSGHSDGAVKKVVSVLVFRYKDAIGNIIQFRTEAIEMPVENLRFKMETQKETTIYVDKNNRNRYYFDIEFLYLRENTLIIR